MSKKESLPPLSKHEYVSCVRCDEMHHTFNTETQCHACNRRDEEERRVWVRFASVIASSEYNADDYKEPGDLEWIRMYASRLLKLYCKQFPYPRKAK